MPVTLYRRQRQIVEFISQYIQKNNYSPTLQEIADAIGLAEIKRQVSNIFKERFIGFIS